jgi:hypothetical protein
VQDDVHVAKAANRSDRKKTATGAKGPGRRERRKWMTPFVGDCFAASSLRNVHIGGRGARFTAWISETVAGFRLAESSGFGAASGF